MIPPQVQENIVDSMIQARELIEFKQTAQQLVDEGKSKEEILNTLGVVLE